MISLLAKIFLDTHSENEADLRKRYGILCGAVGIALNLFLFAGKFFAGTIAGSIAITADAFNNLSDAGSSFVTLLGFQLAGQKADASHPFGHGRIEYLSGLAVSLMILLMGYELAKSSVNKILHPAPVTFDPLVAVILCVSVVVKLYMAFYNRRLGNQLNSGAMLATSVDALSDSAATAAVLAATLIGHFTGLLIDGWTGIIVSLLIVFSGLKTAKETIDPLLGTPPSRELVEQIYSLVLAHPIVEGIHDLIVHDYGPGRMILSLHAEVSAKGDVLEIHDEIDCIEMELQETLGCVAVIHMDPIVLDNAITLQAKQQLSELIFRIDPAITIHDFRMVTGPSHTNVIFDAVVPFNFHLSDEEVRKRIQSAVRTLNGNYFAVVTVERSYI